MKAFTFEFLQNLPLTLGFFYALALFKGGEWIWAILVIFLGTGIGSLLIRWTEGFIVPGELEVWRVTWGNFIYFSAISFAGIAYFSIFPSLGYGWEFTIGATLGSIASLIQSRAANQPLSLRHTLALTLGFGLLFASIRPLFQFGILGAGLANLLVTLIIGWVDYEGLQ